MSEAPEPEINVVPGFEDTDDKTGPKLGDLSGFRGDPTRVLGHPSNKTGDIDFSKAIQRPTSEQPDATSEITSPDGITEVPGIDNN
ncbi:MAG TPA: hypothetical protein VLF90_04130 [Patescibacteria group bacterium]|nr:hypothetical protein [Patescibacteria group bacterium]